MIVLDGVCMRFSSTTVLEGVSFAVAPAEAIALIGPSGSGKTTVLRLIAGLEVPNAGRILLAGEAASGAGWARAPHERGIGMVFQRAALWPHMTVWENVTFGLGGLPRTEVERRTAEVVRLAHLDGLAHRYPHQLSGGEAQRVALARAIAPRPRILLLDEPLSGLDPELRVSMIELVRSVRRETGATLMYVTHDREEGAVVTDRLLVLRKGSIERDGESGGV